MNSNAWLPVTRKILGEKSWERFFGTIDKNQLPESLKSIAPEHNEAPTPPYLADLARLEHAYHEAIQDTTPIPVEVEELSVNPTLQLFEMQWRGIAVVIAGGDWRRHRMVIQPGHEWVMLFKGPRSGKVRLRPASSEELLAIKMVIDDLSPEHAAKAGGVPLGFVEGIVRDAVQKGILLPPPSTLRRNPAIFLRKGLEEYMSTPVFTLQWHITQACDLHCRHCYDRSLRGSIPRDQGIAVLDDLQLFCRQRRVVGQVSFTGGNPLLHPNFLEFYRAAAERGLATAILGNPASRDLLEKILAIQPLEFYQISLEGLEEHNDYIRGAGHFKKALQFLDILRDMEIFSMVMLTLTRDNMDQVLPLAELLRDRVDLFTFNRLSQVGEGASLAPVDRRRFSNFLKSYLEAAGKSPSIRLKDNLINILLHKDERTLSGGCAGYGCGAAFNFAALLPDGEVHACRKFFSPIGNIASQGLGEIYDSPQAEKYRNGPSLCKACPIRPVCGGCLAVSHASGRDIFTDLDPYCFY